MSYVVEESRQGDVRSTTTERLGLVKFETTMRRCVFVDISAAVYHFRYSSSSSTAAVVETAVCRRTSMGSYESYAKPATRLSSPVGPACRSTAARRDLTVTG